MRISSSRGAALAEALVAALVLTTGLLTMARLVSVSTRSQTSSRHTTVATILAAQKLEQLRALAWTRDVSGQPQSDRDTDTTVLPHAPTGGSGLSASPGGVLDRNTPGYVDHLDAVGAVVGQGAQAPPDAVYTRRWSIDALPGTPDQSLRIEVFVTVGGLPAGVGGRLSGQARLLTVKTRKSS
jgi:hypothetical protein